MFYDGSKKKVVLPDDRSFIAFFPKKHSRVKGIIYQYSRYDRNQGDAWANRSYWVEEIVVYVLWKGEIEWEEIVNGDTDISKYNISSTERRYMDSKGDLTPLDQLLLKMEFYPVKRRCQLPIPQGEGIAI